MTSSWDVFHSVRLEVERGIATEVVQARLLAGTLSGDDLIRPAGTTRWSRISQVAAFNATEATLPGPVEPIPAPAPPAPPPPPPARVEVPAPAPIPVPVPIPVPPAVAPPPPPPPPQAPVEPLRLRPEPTAKAEPPTELEFPDEDDFEDSVEAIPVTPPSTAAAVEPLRLRPEPVPPREPEPALPAELEFPDEDDVFVELDDPVEAEPVSARKAIFEEDETTPEPPTLPDDEAGEPHPPELGDPEPPELEASDDAEDDPASSFTLTRNSTERVEELDLAAMVDVAFQLVLFFLVTASTVVFKTLEIPKPNEDKPPEAAAQSQAKPIEELEKDYILVEVDAAGAVKIDHLPVNAERAALVEKLRSARETTGRKAMLLSAEFGTQHRNAVLAFDVASEIDLQIAIAQPTGKN